MIINVWNTTKPLMSYHVTYTDTKLKPPAPHFGLMTQDQFGAYLNYLTDAGIEHTVVIKDDNTTGASK